MKTLIISAVIVFALPSFLAAQKGIDTQTQKIKEEANKTTTRSGEPSRSFDWGKGKTQVRERLANPYKLNSRRDALVETIVQVLKERKMVVDEASSRLADGVVVTQPFVFAKGPVTTQGELHRYGVLAYEDTAWSRAQYTLMIEVQSIDGIQNNVAVNAKIEGRASNGMMSEWVTLPSSGLAEEEFLTKLVENVTGKMLDEPEPVEQ
jgi:hypothetical protein